jgi:DNA-directed RNA polymerase specialized sigma24 family protein
MIATRLAFAPNFINYTYREDMIGDAIVKMVKALREEKFEPTKGSPFSYFTKIAYHAFVNRIKKEKKASEVLAAYQEKIYEDAYASGHGWENVKRQALEDENEYFYENNEDFYKEEEE